MTKGELIKMLEGVPDSAIVLTGDPECGTLGNHVSEAKDAHPCWWNKSDDWVTYGKPHEGPAKKTPAILIN